MLIYVLRFRPSWISAWHKKQKLCRGPSNDHFWAAWLNCPSGFREEAFLDTFPIGSNVKLSPAIATILNFISEQKT